MKQPFLPGLSVLTALTFLLTAVPSVRADDVVEYVVLDGLGNVRVVTDEKGNVLERHDYLAFGEECTTGRCANNPGVGAGEPLKFTGKERDPETGLDYFGARYYGSKIGRFTSVDPVYNWNANLLEPQRWNRYAYVTNNPLRFTDPDGKDKIAEFFLGAAGKNINTLDTLLGREARAQYAQVAREHPAIAGQLAVAPAFLAGPLGAAVKVARLAQGLGGGGGVAEFPDKAAARGAFSGDLGAAANRFFRDAARNAEGFKATDLAEGGKRLEFFSPARNEEYGKRYVQEVDQSGSVAREYNETFGPEGLIETKWIHGAPERIEPE